MHYNITQVNDDRQKYQKKKKQSLQIQAAVTAYTTRVYIIHRTAFKHTAATLMGEATQKTYANWCELAAGVETTVSPPH